MKTIVQVLLYVGLCVSLSTTSLAAKMFNVLNYGAVGEKEGVAGIVFKGRWPSDHRAVVVEYEWQKPQPIPE
jgi:hypothetical protein